MNREAERHLEKAEDYFAKGDGWYAKAADEIIAAQAADFTLSYAHIGERFGRSRTWARDLVTWRTSDTPGNAPFAKETPEAKGRGTVEATRVLRDAPLEQVEQIVAELPFERQQAIAAATGNRYAKARQEHDEKEQRMTPAERKEREAGIAETRTLVAKTMAGFDTFGIVNLLEQATTILGEMIGNDTVDADGMVRVDVALAAFLDEYRVAAAMVNMKPVDA